MRLVPTFNSVLSSANKAKFASCLARQSAMTAGMATGTTWEMATNLMLDTKDPGTGKFFRQIMMAITPEDMPDISLFRTIDRQWRSNNVVTFTFQPKHKAEARSFIAGLIPFLRDEGHTFFLKMFSSEAEQRHLSSRWNSATRQVTSVEEERLEEFLAADDNLNLSDEPTHDKPSIEKGKKENEKVSFDIPEFTPVNFPELNNDIDSVSTFHPNRAQPKQSKVTSSQNPTDMHTESVSTSKMSDMAATISILKSTVSDLNSLFKQSFK